jgi:metal transporter CNNM
MDELLRWIGVALCVTQSGMLSGLNLAVFSVSRLKLQAAADTGDADARRVLALRADANYTLVSILLANVAVNVLLTLLAESLLAGVLAFLFSTLVITFVGEILPQAYFTRHAIPVAARLSPLLRMYRLLLWPVAWPVARLLDRWIGPEGMHWFREEELQQVLRVHARDDATDIAQIEARGAANFLALDDVRVGEEGEVVDPRSVLVFDFRDGRPVVPAFARSGSDPFLQRLNESGRKWVIVADASGAAHYVLNANSFLRAALLSDEAPDFHAFLSRPLIIADPAIPLGDVIGTLTVHPERKGDDVVDEDVVLVWTAQARRIITGADLLGRLLRGIARIQG